MSAVDDGRHDAPADEEVVQRVRTGDVEAFASLVERYQAQILAIGLRFFRLREDAEDFVQEVFLQAYRSLESWRGTGRFYSWLMRIAYNLGLRTRDRRPDYESLVENSLADDAPTPPDLVLQQEARQAVLEAMRRLPPGYADCIGLYFFFELSYQEVSEVTRYPINTVRSHIRRAKRILARNLSGDEKRESGHCGDSHDMP